MDEIGQDVVDSCLRQLKAEEKDVSATQKKIGNCERNVSNRGSVLLGRFADLEKNAAADVHEERKKKGKERNGVGGVSDCSMASELCVITSKITGKKTMCDA